MDPLGRDRAKRLAKLLTAKGRKAEGMMLLDSVPLIDEALRGGLVRELFVSESAPADLVAPAESAAVSVTPATDDQLQKFTDVKTSPGAVALVQLPDVIDLVAFEGSFEDRRFVTYLDHIADPGNVGTIARSVAAFGCDLLVLSPECADPFSPKSIRASAGALLRLPIARGMLEPRSDWPLFLRATSGDATPMYDISLEDRRGLWLGNEAHGPRSAPDGLDHQDVTIPMDRATESLNVTAAAAILAYQLRLSSV